MSGLFQVSGGLAVSSLVYVILGGTGMMGALMTFIGPLTIVPTVALIGLSLFNVANGACKHHWGIAIL